MKGSHKRDIHIYGPIGAEWSGRSGPMTLARVMTTQRAGGKACGNNWSGVQDTGVNTAVPP